MFLTKSWEFRSTCLQEPSRNVLSGRDLCYNTGKTLIRKDRFVYARYTLRAIALHVQSISREQRDVWRLVLFRQYGKKPLFPSVKEVVEGWVNSRNFCFARICHFAVIFTNQGKHTHTHLQPIFFITRLSVFSFRLGKFAMFIYNSIYVARFHWFAKSHCTASSLNNRDFTREKTFCHFDSVHYFFSTMHILICSTVATGTRKPVKFIQKRSI